jgi:hypothetical protein
MLGAQTRSGRMNGLTDKKSFKPGSGNAMRTFSKDENLLLEFVRINF